MHGNFAIQKNIAVIGTGIAGMSAAWLLSQKHKVTVYESDRRIGGHSNTVMVEGAKGAIPVDTGFIVYNEETYPNLTALFEHLDVPTQLSDMSFAVSLADGDLEYSGTNLAGLFAEKRNLFRPRFWSMLRDLQRFYREAPRDLALLEEFHTTLGDYLDAGAYGAAFRRDHLLPMAASIWSAPAATILNYPAAAFIRFQDSHGLLRLRNRPPWRTVLGGSRAYVERLTPSLCRPHPSHRRRHRRAPRQRLCHDPRLPRRSRKLRRCRHRGPRRPGLGDARRSDAARTSRAWRLPL